MDSYNWQWLIESPTLLALLALLLERFVPWPEHWHPLTLFRLFADHLAHKVNRPQHSRAQQRFAGILATVTLLVLVLAPTAIIVYAADFTQLLAAIVLWVALRRRYQQHLLGKIRHFTEKGQKRAARALLTRIDQRDCDRLSAHGLAKATLELQAISLIHHRVAPLAGWFIGGPVLALACRLIIEMAQLWPLVQRRYACFGLAPRALYLMTIGGLFYACAAVAWLLATLGRRRPAVKPLTSIAWDGAIVSWLDNISRLHNVSLGGPILVQGRRFERQRFAGRAAEHVWQPATASLERWQWAITIMLSIAALCLYIYRP